MAGTPASCRRATSPNSHIDSDIYSQLFAFYELPARMTNGLFFKTVAPE